MHNAPAAYYPRAMAKDKDIAIPDYKQYMNPILDALRALGGSATIQELYDQTVSHMKLTDSQLSIMHAPDKSNLTEVGYRMAWARTYLKTAGYLQNSTRGVWSLTATGLKASHVNEKQVVQFVQSRRAAADSEVVGQDNAGVPVEPDQIVPEANWRDELRAYLLAMAPAAFERLCQRLLRESGFVEVRVTGQSGDGGIDGIGLLRIQQVLSFHVIFQCKRWKGSVGAPAIRDFRGAMVGRTDKGLFITTGFFSPEAKKEATRDGAPSIDLVDGDQLVDLLKNLNLGVRTEMVERVLVDREWFGSI